MDRRDKYIAHPSHDALPNHYDTGGKAKWYEELIGGLITGAAVAIVL